MKKIVLTLAIVVLLTVVAFSIAMAAVNPATCRHSSCRWVPKSAATCISAGTEWWTCNLCGTGLYSRTTAKNPNNHPSGKLQWKPGQAATCMSGGTENHVCNGCGKTVGSRTTAKNPNNHKSWGRWYTKEPCSHRAGSMSRTCACGQTERHTLDQEPASSYKPNYKEKISDQTCETDEVWKATCPVCGHPDYQTRAKARGHHMCNTNNNKWPYPNLCEDATYEEWCDRPGCPKNKHTKVVIYGTRHYPVEELINGKYVTVCSVCRKPLPDDYSRYP